LGLELWVISCPYVILHRFPKLGNLQYGVLAES
jgi:hypothetical protein